MKKFLVGLMSIFLVFGGMLFASCQGGKGKINLSSQSVEIEINGEGVNDYVQLTASVSGGSDKTINVSWNGYENIVEASVTPSSSGDSIITIRGLKETIQPARVEVSATGCESKFIDVEVYSKVSSMKQKEETGNQKKNFLVTGQTNTLVEENILEFFPNSNSRRVLSWRVKNDVAGVSISGNNVTLSENFSDDKLVLVAVTERGIESEDITLPVLRKLDLNSSSLRVQAGYSNLIDVVDSSEGQNPTSFDIVSNNSKSEMYQLNAQITYSGNLKVQPVITSIDGKLSTSMLKVTENGFSSEGYPKFKIYSDKNYSSLNGKFRLIFKVGYEGYDYSFVLDSKPLDINVREVINEVNVKDENGVKLTENETPSSLYTKYSLGVHGKKLSVEISPTSVADANYTYQIRVDIPAESQNTQTFTNFGQQNFSPVVLKYKDKNNILQEVVLQPLKDASGVVVEGSYVARGLYASDIYLSSASLEIEKVENVFVTISSEDETSAKSTFNVNLIRAVNDFGDGALTVEGNDNVYTDDEKAFSYILNSAVRNNVVRKRFKLLGQSSISGLHVASASSSIANSTSRYVDLTDENITFVANGEENGFPYVIFDIRVTLNYNAYGETITDFYTIYHDNGTTLSFAPKLDIFLPLSDAVIMYDTSLDANSVVYTLYGKEDLADENYSSSLIELMVKNGSLTPLSFVFNKTTNGKEAQPNVNIRFFDLDDENLSLSIQEFKTKLENGEIVLSDNSGIFYISGQDLRANADGKSIVVFTFTGKGEDGEEISITRILKLESFTSVDGFTLSQEGDRTISLYASDTIAEEQISETKKTVKIFFANSNITYASEENFTFSASGLNSNFEISNVVVGPNKDYIQFTIVALTTSGQPYISDYLDIHYRVRITDSLGDEKDIVDIWTTLNVNILNAQKVENVVWKNVKTDGLYFEVGEKNGQYLVFSVSPTNAKNNTLKYLATDENGNVKTDDSFIKINQISSSQLGVTVGSSVKAKGNLFVYPSDMVYGENIKYYVKNLNSQGNEVDESANLNIYDLGKIKSGSQTWYDFLVENAYFLSFEKTADGQTAIRRIGFDKIIVKINVVIADGSSFDYALRLYSADDFDRIDTNKYYTLMNSVELHKDTEFVSFAGGLQGENELVTIKFVSKNGNISNNLIKSLNGTIQNLTFAGEVQGQGFVCDENNGTIQNVIVDTNGTYSSILTSAENQGEQDSDFVGGITGINNNEIISSKVLGLSIKASGKIVGGICGQNNGKVQGSAVEIYNVQTGEQTFASSYFEGDIVGGVVGQAEENSSIEKCYVYDYTLRANSTVQNGITSPFIGKLGTFENGITTISYSFAVVGIELNYGENLNILYSDVYNSHYKNNTYTSDTKQSNGNNWVSNGQEGFVSYVNKNKSHLKGFYQDEMVSVINNASRDVETNGYNKAVALNDKTLIMLYSVENSLSSLSESARQDLDEFNTINLKDLLGEYKNINVSSSNDRVLKVVGNSLQVIGTGNANLILSSKQDASLAKTIKMQVINAFNGFKVSYGNLEDVRGRKISIQKTKTGVFTVTYNNLTMLLGYNAEEFDIKLPNVEIETEVNNGENLVQIEKTSDLVFTALTSKTSIETDVKVNAKIDNEIINHNLFNSEFTILPEEGAITISLTSEELSITPSINASAKVVVQTTAENDTIIPVVEGLERIKENGTFIFKQGHFEVFEVSIQKQSSIKDDSTGIITDVYNVIFVVKEDFRDKISQNGNKFDIYFLSGTNNSSENITLNISRQSFTSIDMTNSIILSAERNNIGTNDNPIYRDKYKIGEKTSILAPGTSSVLQVAVNPEFAYYDYLEIEYSGTTVAGGVNIEVLTKNGADSFIRDNSAVLTNVGNSLRLIPTKKEAQIFFKLWINTTIENDTTLCFTVRFCDSDGNVLTHANYYLGITYLKEPKVTIDGLETAFLAKGSSSTLEIQVLEEQEIDTLTVSGENVSGISITSLSAPVVDSVKGIKTYFATISASLNANVEGGLFYVKASVRRNINGFDETKDAVAGVILVDFKVDEDNILIGDVSDNEQVLTVWAGVPKSVSIGYGLIPESYPTGEMSKEYTQDLIKARNKFLNEGYYFAGNNVNESKYLINYRDIDNSSVNKNFEKISVSDRLFYIVNGQEVALNSDSIRNASISLYETEGKNELTIIGNSKAGTTLSMVLYTYVNANGIEKVIKTYFKIKIETFSDPDLPLLIDDTSDFLALAPENGTKDKEDYILTNDIVLEDYTPFDTSNIASLDGNGYTIFIKSFKMADDEDSLNIALFNNVEKDTILKNVRVNLYEGGQLKINTSRFKTISVAGFALKNSGVITNCEVVAYETDKTYTAGNQELPLTSTLASDKKAGINIFLTDGENTTQEKFLTKGSNFSISVAGFALQNEGSITNSRVGGESIYEIVDEQTLNGQNVGRTNAREITLENFAIIGQGNMAGFVLENNSGYISASFAKNVSIENRAIDSDYYLSGFVGENDGKIFTSYIEGVKTSENSTQYLRQGSSLKSQGKIAGFVYRNRKDINDCYSNILITNASSDNNVLYASGFVYINSGNITNGFSASQVLNSKFTQMNFSGVDANGNLLADGTYKNCYFFAGSAGEMATEIQYGTGANAITALGSIKSFYGFAVASSEYDDSGIWRMENGGITLIEPNKISHSHRYVLYIGENSGYEGATREDEKGSYILPYSMLKLDTNEMIDTSLGGEANPILITNEKDFVDAMGESQSTYVKKYINEQNGEVFGSYRIVNNIELANLTNENSSYLLSSSSKAFAGKLYGNGFEISGIKLTSSREDITSYGLFKSLESLKKNNQTLKPIVTNLSLALENITAGEVPMVGALAGYIKDATIVGINITFKTNAEIVGLNYVGSLAGYAFGQNVIKNVTITDPNVYARYYQENQKLLDYKGLKEFSKNVVNLSNLTTFDNKIIERMRGYSYAGSLFGFVDNTISSLDEGFVYNEFSNENFTIDNVKVTGDVKAKAMVAGGAIGLSGSQTHIRDISVVFDGNSKESSSSIYSMFGYAGGVIGQAFGGVTKISASHTDEVQQTIESDMNLYYAGNNNVERGILNLFTGAEAYTQKAIGGLIGYAGSGILTNSFSKLNVTSSSASFAGGVIGQINAGQETTYTAVTRVKDALVTNYLLNEVYATGDVRSSKDGFAGGIVGKTSGGKITLLSVNAYNYLTTYNYEKGTMASVGTGKVNLTKNLNVNLFVGQIENSSETSDKISDISTYSNNVEFALGSEVYASEGSSSSSEGKDRATVSYYKSYEFSSSEVSFNLLGGVAGETAYSDSTNSAYVYVINGPRDFANIESSLTQEGFLSSGIWMRENWKHNSERLFPEIYFRNEADTILYLDNVSTGATSPSEVFAQMQYNNVTVVVRGLTNGGEYQDVDLRNYSWNEVNGFSGTIMGGGFKKSDGSGDVGIISNTNFLDSVKEGFNVIDLTVTYEDVSAIDTTGNNAGLFVNSRMTSAKITNLKINLNSQINFTGAINNTRNIGIVAPEIENTTISGLSINYTGEKSGKTIVFVAGKTENGSVQLNSFGMVSGLLTQSSEISLMEINNVSVKANESQLLSIDGYSKYVGGLFGKVEKSKGLSFKMTEIDANLNLGTKNIFVRKTNPETYLGGVIGYANGIDDFALSQNTADGKFNVGSIEGKLYAGSIFGKAEGIGTLNTTLQGISGGIVVGGVGENATLYAGGFAGENKNSSVTKITLENNKSEFSVEVNGTNDTNVTLANAYIGGLVGLNSAGKLDVTSGRGIKLNAGKSDKHLKTNQAYVGGIVGQTDGALEVKAKDSQFTLSGDVYIDLKTTTGSAKVGSVVGYAKGEVTISSKGQDIISNLNINIARTTGDSTTDKSTASVGGMVGTSETKVTISGESTNTEDKDSTNTKLVRYDGRVTTNVKTIYFGGMVGKFDKTNTQNTSDLTTKYTSFGGQLRVQGDKSNGGNVYVGGVVGQTNAQTEISNSYNYGDVFIDYDATLQKLNAYYFGGLVGLINGTVSVKATDTYNLMSSHNARQFAVFNTSGATDDYTAKALVGSGTLKDSGNNYYNHKICLVTDDSGVDVGYTQSYTESYRGYDDSTNVIMIKNADGEEKEIGSSLAGENGVISKIISSAKGSKLNPIINEEQVGNGEPVENEEQGTSSTKGLTYYTYFKDANNAKSFAFGQTGNIALIYESNEAYVFENNENNRFGLVNTLSGHSYMAGFVVENNRDINDADTSYFGGLVGTMQDNSMVYACQTVGTLEVGGTGTVTISGLVGKVESGRIFDSSTDITLVYRAGSNGMIAGLTTIDLAKNDKNDVVGFASIENCYTGGRLTSYISANAYALAYVNGGNATNVSIASCLTYSKFDLHDYVSGSLSGNKGVINIRVNNGNGVFYDSNALEWKDNNVTDGIYFNNNRLYQGASNTGWNSRPVWRKDIRFNYCYPTLSYGYLKNSSFVFIENDNDIKTRGTSGYDANVYEITYTQRPNGYLGERYPDGDYHNYENGWDTQNNYYKINSAGVLSWILNDNKNGSNFILTNDIDLSKTGCENNPTGGDISFQGVLDGQNHKISGLKKSLFYKIVGSYDSKQKTKLTLAQYIDNKTIYYYSGIVLNLKLLDANINNSLGILTNYANDVYISNITLSGELDTPSSTQRTSIGMGGLSGLVYYNAKISAITNLARVSHSRASGAFVGGIVGGLGVNESAEYTRGNVDLLYCVNYGPINLTGTKTSKTTYSAGGIAGMATSAVTVNMDFCANMSSVLCGFVKKDAQQLETSELNYNAGGILGNLQGILNLTNCYNSGLIIAGNKNSVEAIVENISHRHLNCPSETDSHAAGILGFSLGGGNYNHAETYNREQPSYNEGAIYAFSKAEKSPAKINATISSDTDFINNKWQYYCSAGGQKVVKDIGGQSGFAFVKGYLSSIADSIKTLILTDNVIIDGSMTVTVYGNGHNMISMSQAAKGLSITSGYDIRKDSSDQNVYFTYSLYSVTKISDANLLLEKDRIWNKYPIYSSRGVTTPTYTFKNVNIYGNIERKEESIYNYLLPLQFSSTTMNINSYLCADSLEGAIGNTNTHLTIEIKQAASPYVLKLRFLNQDFSFSIDGVQMITVDLQNISNFGHIEEFKKNGGTFYILNKEPSESVQIDNHWEGFIYDCYGRKLSITDDSLPEHGDVRKFTINAFKLADNSGNYQKNYGILLDTYNDLSKVDSIND